MALHISFYSDIGTSMPAVGGTPSVKQQCVCRVIVVLDYVTFSFLFLQHTFSDLHF